LTGPFSNPNGANPDGVALTVPELSNFSVFPDEIRVIPKVYASGSSFLSCICTGGFTLISSPFVSYLWVALGAAIGAMLRFAAYRAVSATSFPLATLLVNTVGSFLIGLLAMLLLSDTKVDQSVRLFLQTGLLGALTTFSAFSLETVQLFQTGSYKAAVANILLNVLLCLAAVLCGMWLGAVLRS